MIKLKGPGFLVIWMALIYLGAQCTSYADRTASKQVLSNADSARVDSATHVPKRQSRQELMIGVEVFYRRAGGYGDKQFANLKDGDSIHYLRPDGAMTQRVYQVTYNRHDIDSLQSINMSILKQGEVLSSSNVGFTIQDRDNYPLIIFYDGIPLPNSDLVQISFQFFNRRTRTTENLLIYMLLDLEPTSTDF